MLERLKLSRKIPTISTLFELGIILAMAAWVGRDYLHFDNLEVPLSPEFMASIQSHEIWSLLVDCGGCSLWNSSTQGGFPALADYSGAGIHPVIGLVTLVWGSIDGAKIAIVLSLAIAGYSQWWLGKELNARGILCVWGAIVILAGGHLASRMGTGAFPILFSTAMCSLMIPGVIRLAKRGGRHEVALLSALLASSLLSGGGYLQVGLLTYLPGVFILAFTHHGLDYSLLKKYTLACLIGFLLAAPFLIPFIHFAPNIEVLATSDQGSAQPLEYIPLNFVIRDMSFYLIDMLGKLAESTEYISYIGWVPILLAMMGIADLVKSSDRRIGYFLVIGILLSLYLASDLPWRGVLKNLSINEAAHPSGYLLGLTIPLIVGLATMGANSLFDGKLRLISIQLGRESFRSNIRPVALLLLFPLLLNLDANISTSKEFLTTRFQTREVDWAIEVLQTETLAWVATPRGESEFITPAISSTLKLSSTRLPWRWEDSYLPVPRVEASRDVIADAVAIYQSQELNGISIYLRSDVHYAAVDDGAKKTPCGAYGHGGHLVVHCVHEQPGTLMIHEHAFDGWKVSRDGEAIPLLEGSWLSVNAPAGEHEYVFEYSPWDFKIGVVLFGISTVLLVSLMIHPNKHKAQS